MLPLIRQRTVTWGEDVMVKQWLAVLLVQRAATQAHRPRAGTVVLRCTVSIFVAISLSEEP